MGPFAAAFVVIGFGSDEAPASMQPVLSAADIALTIIFVAEFGTTIAASYDRAADLARHWIDLLALVPTARGLRLLRLVRLLRLIRTFAGVYRALSLASSG